MKQNNVYLIFVVVLKHKKSHTKISNNYFVDEFILIYTILLIAVYSYCVNFC